MKILSAHAAGLFLSLCLFTVFGRAGAQDAFPLSYRVDTVRMPPGLTAQTGGVDFFPDGRLVACFMRGEVMTYDPGSKKWELFAEGLQGPLGVLATGNDEVLVMQLPELTRIRDTDGDGHADVYEKAADGFGISGNYHEFNYGPVRDSSGNLYFALNTASSQGGRGGIRATVRGEVNPHGRDGADGRRQMFSVVPYRGWVMELGADGKLVPFASGFRSPNGLGIDLQNRLFVTDNQSDWVETSALYHVREGRFYGHPASLVWEPGWEERDPLNAPVAELDSMRTKAAVLFPQGIMANSPAQPLVDGTGGVFGPFSGQLFVGEMNHDRIVRVMLEEVGGELQGACIPFIDGHGLRFGNNRLAFGPDGSLWVGQTDFGGWVGHSGMQRIVFTGETPMDVLSMKLTEKGFDLTFTQALSVTAALDTSNYHFRHYGYEYKKKDFNEGIDISTQVDVGDVKVTGIRLSDDGRTVSLELDELKAGLVYELKLGKITNPAGRPLDNSLVCYTLNKLLPKK